MKSIKTRLILNILVAGLLALVILGTSCYWIANAIVKKQTATELEILATDIKRVIISAYEMRKADSIKVTDKTKLKELLNPEDMRIIREKINSIKIANTGYPYVIDSSGLLIVHPAQQGQSLWETKDATGKLFVQDICKQKDGWITYPWMNRSLGDTKPREKIVRFVYFKELDWIIAAGSYLDEYYSPLQTLRNTIFIAALIILLVFGIFAFTIARSLTTPIISMMDVIKAFGKGDLTARADVKTNDEIGQMAESIATMGTSMMEISTAAKEMASGNFQVDLKMRSDKDELISSLRNMIGKVKTMVGKIVSASDQIAASSEELSKTSQNLAEGAQQQAASLEEASASMEEMTNSVDQVAMKAQSQAASVEEVTSSVVELNASIKGVSDMSIRVKGGAENAVKLAIEAEKSSGETTAAMKQIESSSTKISKIINVISDIADQTNLLALNASIEAARAGDAGRGFAVVAKEISNLADKSAEATKEIGDLITETTQNVKNGADMVKIVDVAIKKIRDSSEESARYGAEMANATEQQLSGSKMISDTIQNVNTLSQSIATSAEEQASTTKEMSNMIEKINSITQHSASSAEELAASTEEMSGQAENLKTTAAMFKI